MWQLTRALRRRLSRRPAPGRTGEGTVRAGRWSLIALPLAWVLLTFFWQGMQWVKSIRYFLPIYPYLAAFAITLVVAYASMLFHTYRASQINPAESLRHE